MVCWRGTNSCLRFNPNFDEASDDGEGVADDEQDVPAVDELQSVAPAHAAAEHVFKVLHVLLMQHREDMEGETWHVSTITAGRKIHHCLGFLRTVFRPHTTARCLKQRK